MFGDPGRSGTGEPHAGSPGACGLQQAEVGAALLRALPAADYEQLRPHLQRVPLRSGDVLAEAGEEISSVCFLEGGIAGFLDVLEDGRRVAVGLVGREGFVGWPLLMGEGTWRWEVRFRAAHATALRLDAEHLRTMVSDSPTSRNVLLGHAASFTAQMSRTIVSNLLQTIDRRAARWLLLYYERLEGDVISITHEELSAMLGVRRASITEALHVLEGGGAIRSRRGQIRISDHKLLRAIAESF